MEWDPTERDAWVSDAQRWISRITGVLQCKIDLDEAGEVTGVHVVAGMERDPRHIVRDVEGMLKARLGLDVYYKKIGVVQVLENGVPTEPVAADAGAAGAPPAPGDGQSVPGSTVTFHPPHVEQDGPAPAVAPATPAVGMPAADPAEPDLPDPVPAILVAEDISARVVCVGVGVMATETTIRAEVQLRLGEVPASGQCEGPNHADSDVQLLAEAALAAVVELISDPVLLHLREVRLQEVGGQTVVLTAVDLVEGRQSQTLFGACGTSHNRQQAVVYSVLDALNRRLSLLGLKTLEADG